MESVRSLWRKWVPRNQNYQTTKCNTRLWVCCSLLACYNPPFSTADINSISKFIWCCFCFWYFRDPWCDSTRERELAVSFFLRPASFEGKSKGVHEYVHVPELQRVIPTRIVPYPEYLCNSFLDSRVIFTTWRVIRVCSSCSWCRKKHIFLVRRVHWCDN